MAATERPQREDQESVEVFPRAPIVEAILWLEFPALDNLEDTLSAFAGDLAENFTAPETHQRPSPPAATAVPPRGKAFRRDGYAFDSRDRHSVVRISRTAFSFHRLRPYTCWDDLASGARAAWAAFVRRYEPEYVSAVGLRFLNHIQTAPGHDLSEYLRLLPQIPAPVDTGREEYLLRLFLRDDTVPAVAEITQLSKGEAPINGGIAFDIEVSYGGEEYVPADVRLWEQMARLREYKNRLFFSSITEHCRELFR